MNYFKCDENMLKKINCFSPLNCFALSFHEGNEFHFRYKIPRKYIRKGTFGFGASKFR